MTFAGPLCALLSSCTWAVGVSAYGRLARGHAGAAINASRALVSLPLFVAAHLATAGGFGAAWAQLVALPPRNVGFLALSIFSSYALGDTLFLLATRALGVPAALAIASTYPVWAALAGVLFRGEPFAPVRLAGVFAVVAGTILVIGSSGAAAESPPPEDLGATAAAPARPKRGAVAIGALLALLTSAMWTLNGVSLNVGGEGVPVALASALRMTFALALCPLSGLLMARLPGAPAFSLFLPWPALKAALPALLLESFAGTLLFTYGLAHSPLSVGAALSSLTPVLAVPIAVATGIERFSAIKTAGTALCVLGVFLLVL